MMRMIPWWVWVFMVLLGGAVMGFALGMIVAAVTDWECRDAVAKPGCN